MQAEPEAGAESAGHSQRVSSSTMAFPSQGGLSQAAATHRSAAPTERDVQALSSRASHQRSISLSAGPAGARSASAIDQYRPRLSGSPVKSNRDLPFPPPHVPNAPLSPDSPVYSPSPFSYPLGNSGRGQSPEVDAKGAALLQSARIRVSSRDQEAMRRMRSVLDQSDSASASSSPRSDTPPSPVNSSTHDGQDQQLQRGAKPSYRHTRTASTLSQVLATAGEDPLVADQTDGPEAGPSRLNAGPTADYSIVVVGASGVGKSTFIAKALRSWGQAPGEDIQLRGGRKGWCPPPPCRSQSHISSNKVVLAGSARQKVPDSLRLRDHRAGHRGDQPG